jgi:hypothetical protein
MVDKQHTATISGSRVFWLDRECYVIYMGKGDRQYRPFLRIGTSEHLPADIRRHIGSVVLPDRMTGDYFDEVDCLEKPITRHMHYVGSPELIKAVRHFIRKEEIALQPIESVTDAPEEAGAKVHFFRDGNLRVFMDGHRLFDLLEREKSDNHEVHVYTRCAELASQDAGTLDEKDLRKSGFIRLPGAGTLLYEDGIIETAGLSRSVIRSLAGTLIPLSLVRRFGGEANRDALFSLVKWHHVENRSIEFVMEDLNGETGPTTDLEADLLELLKHIDARARAHDGVRPDSSVPLPLPAASSDDGAKFPNRLRLLAGDPATGTFHIDAPEGTSWSGGRPLVLPGIAYSLHERRSPRSWKSEVEETQKRLEHLMGSAMRSRTESWDDAQRRSAAIRDALADRTDPVGSFALLCWAWNRWNLSGGEAPFGPGDYQQLESRQEETLLPFRGRIVESDGGWTSVLVLAKDITRGEVKQRLALKDKILALLDRKDPRDIYEAERTRLAQAIKTLQAVQTGKVPPPQEAADGIGTAAAGHNGKTGSTAAQPGETAQPAGSASGGEARSAIRREASESRAVAAAASGRRGTAGRWIIAALVLAAVAVLIWFLFFRSGEGDLRPDPGTLSTGTEASGTADAGTADAGTADAGTADAGTADTGTSDGTGEDDDADTSSDGATESASEAGTADTEASGANGSAADDTADSDTGTDASPGSTADGTAGTADAGTADAGTADAGTADAGTADAGTADAGTEFDSVWSAAEILMVANWIAGNNGYALIGEESDLKSNPDWIFTGNEFVLPGGEMYAVVDGDMIWSIADEYLTREFRKSGQSIDEFRVNIEKLNYNRSGD